MISPNEHNELDFISSNGKRYMKPYRITIHTSNNTFYLPGVDYSIDTIKDYESKQSDLIIMNIPLTGNVIRAMANDRDLSEIHLNLVDQKNKSVGKPLIYRAILIPNNDIGNLTKATLSETQLEQIVYPVDIQLIDIGTELLEDLMLIPCIIEDTSRPDTLDAIVSSVLADVKIKGEPIIEKLAMVEPDNKDPIGRLIVPSNVPLLDAPKLLQQNGGFYINDINIYFSRYNTKLICYVYPKHNYATKNKFITGSKFARKLVIVIGTDDAYTEGLEPSFYSNSRTVRVIVTKKDLDNTRVNQNPITAVSEINAPALVEAPVDTGINKPVIHHQQATMTHTAMKKRVDKINPVLTPVIERNNFEAASSINSDNMDIMLFQWNHSEASVLHPGQEVEIIQYIHDKEVRINNATLLSAHVTNLVSATGNQIPLATETTILKVGIQPTAYNINEGK